MTDPTEQPDKFAGLSDEWLRAHAFRTSREKAKEIYAELRRRKLADGTLTTREGNMCDNQLENKEHDHH